jgi:hypothetical protein
MEGRGHEVREGTGIGGRGQLPLDAHGSYPDVWFQRTDVSHELSMDTRLPLKCHRALECETCVLSDRTSCPMMSEAMQ